MTSEPADWRRRVDEFWRTADTDDPVASVGAMGVLVAERPDGDAEALFEWASVHDFVGRERDAVGLYRRALDAGLRDPWRAQAVVQLASSLRNLGAADEAVRVLEGVAPAHGMRPAADAFRALALHDLGRHDEALRVALGALAPTLPLYGAAVGRYADELSAASTAERIRVIAVGLAVRDDHVLVEVYPPTTRHPGFVRALGGGVEVRETARSAVVREFREELGVEVEASRVVAVTENIFESGGKRGHEIVHVFAVRGTDLDAIPLDAERRVADSHTVARWLPLHTVRAGSPTFYPVGMADILEALRREPPVW